ncbi:MAG: histidine phosphatase family protein [Candidatus Micrarchaeota archaeon]|nr:histidine phosphatase family protein [Candidatus Micrarchaeota archaeon]
MERRLIIVRHGETEAVRTRTFSHPHLNLNERGVAQAREVGREFAERKLLVDTVIISPNARNLQTANAILGSMRTGPRVIIAPALDEKDQGRATGLPIPNSVAEVDRLAKIHGGETFGQAIERVGGAFDNLVDELRTGRLGNTVMLVGNGIANRVCLASVLELRGVEEMLRLAQSPCCINEVFVNGGRPVLTRLNGRAGEISILDARTD